MSISAAEQSEIDMLRAENAELRWRLEVAVATTPVDILALRGDLARATSDATEYRDALERIAEALPGTSACSWSELAGVARAYVVVAVAARAEHVARQRCTTAMHAWTGSDDSHATRAAYATAIVAVGSAERVTAEAIEATTLPSAAEQD